ncbi:hypothetical protein [Streptomyces cinereoruber]|uniref:hypothetical protein n=1 Tax=Streptomyces cinereoruber TaxID=67260 RepID=UPI00362DB42F
MRGLWKVLDDVALRHVTGRAWTMPDGTRTRVLLLKFSSVAHADHLDGALTGDADEALPQGVDGAEVLDRVAGDVRVPDATAYAYEEKAPLRPGGDPVGPHQGGRHARGGHPDP